MHPWCVHLALNTTASPAFGWDTMSFWPPGPSTEIAPPTGTSSSLASVVPPEFCDGLDDWLPVGWSDGAGDAESDGVLVLVLSASPPHATRTPAPAAPTTATPSRRRRD